MDPDSFCGQSWASVRWKVPEGDRRLPHQARPLQQTSDAFSFIFICCRLHWRRVNCHNCYRNKSLVSDLGEFFGHSIFGWDFWVRFSGESFQNLACQIYATCCFVELYPCTTHLRFRVLLDLWHQSSYFCDDSLCHFIYFTSARVASGYSCQQRRCPWRAFTNMILSSVSLKQERRL